MRPLVVLAIGLALGCKSKAPAPARPDPAASSTPAASAVAAKPSASASSSASVAAAPSASAPLPVLPPPPIPAGRTYPLAVPAVARAIEIAKACPSSNQGKTDGYACTAAECEKVVPGIGGGKCWVVPIAEDAAFMISVTTSCGADLCSGYQRLVTGRYPNRDMLYSGRALLTPHLDVAFVDGPMGFHNRLTRIDLATGVSTHAANCGGPALSPSKRYLACANDEEFFRVPVAGGPPVVLDTHTLEFPLARTWGILDDVAEFNDDGTVDATGGFHVPWVEPPPPKP
ncbi:MAG: hypothetical protein IPJ34_40985 [Myxococcales bacterium]|nr:hypothetical protein [Myxococcales bacterium]